MESRPWGTVVWEDRAGSCGNAIGVSNLVEQGLAAKADHDPLFVRAEVERARVGRTRASLFLRRGSAIAVRDLDAASCEELARATALVIAMAYEIGLDPQPASAAPENKESETAGARPAEPAPAPAPAAPADAERAREPAPSKVIYDYDRSFTVGPIADYGTLPELSAGVRARVARDFGVVGVSFHGIYLPSTDRKLNGVDLDIAYAAGGLRLFRCWRHPEWMLDLSMGLALGQYWVDAGATPLAREGKPPFAAIEVGFEFSYRISDHFRARAGLEYALHANRASYSSNDRSVWAPAGGAYRLNVGPEIVF